MVSRTRRALEGLAVVVSLFLLLNACSTVPEPPLTNAGPQLEFLVDPEAQTVTVVAAGQDALSPQYLPSDTRILVPEAELRLDEYNYVFLPGNKLVVQTRFSNATTDLRFQQPFFFTLNADTARIKSASAPLVLDKDLGTGGGLNPGETTSRLDFEVKHKNKRFSFFVDTSAVVLEKTALSLRTDASGGDCTLVGNWAAASATCTLTQDVFGTVRVDASGLTLDGDGHALTGSGSGYGVFAPSRTGVTVRNLTVQTFAQAVRLEYGGGHTVENVTATDNFIGIHPFESRDNTLRNNTARSNSYGIYLYGAGCYNSTLTSNLLADNDIVGIQLTGAHDNVVTHNTIRNTVQDGLYIWDFSHLTNAVDNLVTRNNFIDNGVQARVRSGLPNSFSNVAQGGNYWSDFDTPAEGCFDTNSDGVCDAPYTITPEIEDDLPWTQRDGWLSP